MNVGMKNGLKFVAFWSVQEGGDPVHDIPALGYIAADGITKLSPYYHFQMMATRFRGTYAAGTVNVAEREGVRGGGCAIRSSSCC